MFAIGAVVAPPDAVAATAIGRRIGLPRRIVTILEGESLLNDATALVALRTAIARPPSPGRSWPATSCSPPVAASLVGLAFFFVVGLVRKHVTDPVIDSGLSFLTPFAAYVAAEQIHASGVLGVVVAGLLLGHKAPILQTAQSRIAERMNWRSIAFLLESRVFLLIGLQARTIIGDAVGGEVTIARVLAVCGATLVAVIVLRLVWVFFARYLLVRPGPDGVTGRKPPWTYTFLLGWAGMRGVVTLAAAFVIPPETPHRDVLLLVAFIVTAGTLFIQGLSLPWLARRLRVPSPGPGERRAGAREPAPPGLAGRARRARPARGGRPAHGGETIRDRVQRRDFAAWERLGAGADETPSEAYARRRKLMIDAERGGCWRSAAPAQVAARGGRGGARHARRGGVDARLLRRASVDRVRSTGGGRHPRGRLRAPAEAGRRSSRRPPASARTACARAPRGCTCGCASAAATSPAATPRPGGTPAPTTRTPATR